MCQAVNGDDSIPMDVSNQEDSQKEQLLSSCFVTNAAKETIFRCVVSGIIFSVTFSFLSAMDHRSLSRSPA